MKVYGYCRISTARQSLTRQIENIRKAYPEAEIVSEVFTGTKSDRPEWQKLLKKLSAGDTVVFDSVSRMSRNAEEGIKTYFELYNKGVNLMFLKEQTINTDSYKSIIGNERLTVQVNTNDDDTDALINDVMKAVAKYIARLAVKQIELAFQQAEKEVMDLRQRTSETLNAADKAAIKKMIDSKTGTTYKVKKSAPAKEIIKKNYVGYGGSNTVAEVCKIAGISRNSFFKYKREIDSENN